MLPNKILGIFYMYGLMIAVGILAAFGLLFYYGKKKKVEAKFIDFLFYDAIAAIAIGFGSAAVFQATYNYIENPEAGFDLGGGITFLGGFIGGAIAFLVIYFLFRRKFKTRLSDVISFIPCCILIGHAFGRIGCFFAGCCYGKETNSIWGVQFPKLDHKVYPTQLYEAIFLFALFAVCFYLVWRKNFKHNLSVYFIAYGIFRFCIEFLRGDDRGQLLGFLTPSQFWAIGMVVIGIAVFFLSKYVFFKKRAEELAAEKAAPVVEAQTEEIEETTEAEK